MRRGQVATLPNGEAAEADHESASDKPAEDIVPKPPERRPTCNETAGPARQTVGGASMITLALDAVARPDDVIALTPNVIAVRHCARARLGRAGCA
jgi:hypothetical protein